MSTLREAAQQALMALEDACGNRCNVENNPCYQRIVAEVLRAALAQPDEKFCDTHCAWTDHHSDCDLRTAAFEEANRRANAGWRLMCKKMVAIEREACAEIINDNTDGDGICCADDLLAAIRARLDGGQP